MLPHWPKVGVGDAISDQLQQAALSSPQWASVEARLNVEGADPIKMLAAKATFSGAFTSLIAPANGFGVDESEALDAAGQITTVGQTILGSVNTVSGLVQDITSGSSQQIAQQFTGGLIALAVGAGAVSAGLGAAIVAGVGALLTALQSFGLFKPPPTLVEVQGCGPVSQLTPTMMVGCVTGFTDPNLVHIKPGSSTWRRFPRQGSSYDRHWFEPGNTYVPQWNNVDWGAPGALNTARRPIDIAFSNYNWVERGATRQGINFSSSPLLSGSSFMQGFANAWCANAEYTFNGLKPQDDPAVLVHYLRIWNRANSSSSTVTMYQGGNGSYAESLVTAVHGITSEFDTSDGGLRVNVGQRIQPSTSYHGALLSSSAPSGLSTGAKVAAGVAVTGGAALIGSAAYAAYTHQSFGALWASILRRAKFW